MKPSDLSRRQRAARLTFSEDALAQVVKGRENRAELLAHMQRSAELLAQSQQLVATSRKLRSQQVGYALHKLANNVGSPGAGMAASGSAERETGRRTWDGRPDAPQCSAWHWIEDGDGLRPVLWHGEDWPDPLSRGVWQDGFASLSPGDLGRAHYHGPLAMPAGIAPSRRSPTDQGS